MFKKIAGCVLVCLILWMIYIVFHSPGSVTKFAPQRISEVCGVSGTKLIYLREEGESALYRAKTMDVDFSELLQIVDERGCTAPFVYSRSSSS